MRDTTRKCSLGFHAASSLSVGVVVDAAVSLELLGRVLSDLGQGLVAEESRWKRSTQRRCVEASGTRPTGRSRPPEQPGARRAGGQRASNRRPCGPGHRPRLGPDRCPGFRWWHPRPCRDPRAGSRAEEEPHGPEPVLVYFQHPRSVLIYAGQRDQARLVQRRAPVHHEPPERRSSCGHNPA